MRKFFSEYLSFTLSLISGTIVIGIFFGVLSNPLLEDKLVMPLDRIDKGVSIDYQIPDILSEDFIINNNILSLNEDFDLKKHLSVHDTNGQDLSNFVMMDGIVDTSKSGLYDVKLILRWNGKTIIKKATFYVKANNETYIVYGNGRVNSLIELYKDNELYSSIRVNDKGMFKIMNVLDGIYEIRWDNESKMIEVKGFNVFAGTLL